jgi:hypothetical protein
MNDQRVEQSIDDLRRELSRHRAFHERQADALEAIADQLAIQNAVLFELVRQQERRAQIAMERPPDETRTPESTATAVQDAALHLAERVDLDEVRRWADE